MKAVPRVRRGPVGCAGKRIEFASMASAEYLRLDPAAPDPESIRHAAEALARGALVAFPTETVYGLAVNAAHEEGVQRLRDVKGRTAAQPFTVHIGRRGNAEEFVPELSALAQRFIRKGWPGPLTLIFPVKDPRAARVHSKLSPAGAAAVYADGTVGLRFPDLAVAADLLAEAGVPIIASSANVTGTPPPVEADPIRRDLGERIDLILDGGPTRYRKSSTIVLVNGGEYKIVRQGILDERAIRNLAAVQILFVCSGNTCRSPIAEGLLKQMLAQKLNCRPAELADRGIIVKSAGTSAFGGGRATPEAVDAAGRRGVDISSHLSRPLTLDLIYPSDYIFVMGRQHLDAIRSMSPADVDKASLLNPQEEIDDPIGGERVEYDRVTAKIGDALKARMEEVAL